MEPNQAMRILWTRFQVEFPGYAEQFQLYMMKEGLPMTHKEYVGVKLARSGGRPVTKYKLVMWLGMVVREWDTLRYFRVPRHATLYGDDAHRIWRHAATSGRSR